VLGGIPGLEAYAAAILVLGIALRAGSYLGRFVARPIPLIRATAIPVFVFWAGLAVTTGLVPATAELRGLFFGPRTPANAPNVLLIVLDTVRADHLCFEGYHRSTAPNLARLARDGLDFRQARATTPFTLGTHASLFTGHWMSETSARANAPLDSNRRTLAEHFRDRGYASAGFVGNLFYGSAHYGLDRGFLHYHDAPANITRRVDGRELCRASNLGNWLVGWFERKNRIFEPLQRRRIDAAEINREALAWIDRTRRHHRPYFLFLNYFDAHSPYSISHSAPRAYARTTSQRIESNLEHLKQLETEEARDPSLAAKVMSMRAKTAAQVADAYDDGIAWIDHHLGLLFRDLEARGLLENTLIVVTSDHGEMLGEHGLIGHGQALYRELVHVPLLIRGTPAMAIPRGLAVDVPVTVRDVPATILDLLGERASPLPGVSLRRYWDHGSAENLNSPVVSEMQHLAWQPKLARTPAAFGPMWVLTQGDWSYHRQDRANASTEALFHLATDPGENVDLASDPAHEDTLLRMRKDLSAWLARAKAE
jgi:arylsulfatase A-like enzyme